MKIIITESQLRNIVKNILNEEIPYQIAQKYTTIIRNSEVEDRIKRVFNNLKSLPKARQLDNKGNRISFPYGEDSTEDEIETILKQYQFTIKDYKNNLAIDMRSNKEISLSRALSIVSKKEPDVKELMDRYATIKSKGVIDKEESLMIVFSSDKYDIAGMSTDRDWDSCMNVIKGGKKKYVERDIKEGSIICYLTKSSDTNIEKPLGRVLIKPYINMENNKDVILYTEDNTYGNIPNPEIFVTTIDTYMEKIQNLSGTYKRLGCLYDDSYRNEIQKREETEKSLKLKLENKDYFNITPIEFMSMSTINKRKIIDIYLSTRFSFINVYHFHYMSQSQKNTYFRLVFTDKEYIGNTSLPQVILKNAPTYLKKEIIDVRIQNNAKLNDDLYKIATPEQKERYIRNSFTKEKRFNITTDIFNDAPIYLKYEFIDFKIQNKYDLYREEYQIATPKQREIYIRNLFDKNDLKLIPDHLFNDAPKDLKKLHIDNMLKYKQYLSDKEFNNTTPEQKEKYFKFLKEKLYTKLENGFPLRKHEFELLTPEQKEKYIHNRILKVVNIRQGNRGEPFDRLYSYEFELITQKQKEKYINLLLSRRTNLSDFEFMSATEPQRQRSIERIILSKIGLLPDYFEKYATDSQKERYKEAIEFEDSDS